MKIDVSENDKSYTVRADIPGVKKEDIAVNIDDNQVSISAEVREEKEKKNGEKLVHKERFYGNVYRSFTLPQDVDEKAAQAHYEQGVWNSHCPKSRRARLNSWRFPDIFHAPGLPAPGALLESKQ